MTERAEREAEWRWHPSQTPRTPMARKLAQQIEADAVRRDGSTDGVVVPLSRVVPLVGVEEGAHDEHGD